MIPVNEIFQTMQGEARWTGTPSVFVRLQGCDVGCPWCDTKHTWRIDPAAEIPIDAMRDKTLDAPTFAAMTVDQIVEEISRHKARHVVITGGEPCVHDLGPLTSEIIRAGRSVQIETSGTQPIRASGSAWVTLSPKLGMPGGFDVLASAVERADEIKMPVGKMDDVDRLVAFLSKHKAFAADIWLQPLSRSAKATELCQRVATDRGWKVSIQVHALLGIR